MRGWLNDIVKIVHGWIEVITLPNKTLIRLSKKVSDYEIGETIKMHYSNK